jgi:hypothetical protein
LSVVIGKLIAAGNRPTVRGYPIDTYKEADVLNLKRLMNGAVPGRLLNPKQPSPTGTSTRCESSGTHCTRVHRKAAGWR